MPVKENIGKNHITEKMLLPHLLLEGSSTRQLTEASDYDSLPAGETIQFGDALFLSDNSKVYRADCQSSKPTSFIALNSAQADEDVILAPGGFIEYEQELFTAGNKVWLSSGATNISSDLPDIQQGYIVQKVGEAVSSTVLFINIQTSFIIE
jgi:hypothetical protein